MKLTTIILFVAIILAMGIVSCSTYKNAPGCGSYSHWESKHKFKNR